MTTAYKPEKPQTAATPPVGSNICMCPTCREFFAHVTAFDQHRQGDYDVGRHCVEPSTAGLKIVPVPSGTVWADASVEDDIYIKQSERMRRARAASKQRKEAA